MKIFNYLIEKKNGVMPYIVVFIASLIITIAALPFLISFLTRLHIVDSPGGRHINTAAIPRMGGILIYTIIIMAILVFTDNVAFFRYMLFSSVILAMCGMLDDLNGLGWRVKLVLQSVSTIVFLIYLYPMLKQVEFFGAVLPFPFDLIILFLLVTGSVNAINMLDGMDGLVSGFSLMLFTAIFILSFLSGSSFLAILSAAAVGSLLGFLKFNASPARIYLGDTGSLVLGFFLVVSALLFAHGHNPQSLDLGFPIILLGLPLADTLKVMAIRTWNGKSIFQADRNHIHHIISGHNITQKTTVLIIEFLTVVFIILSLTYLYYDKFTTYILFCTAAVSISFIKPILKRVRIKQKIKLPAGKPIPEGTME